MNDWGKVVKTAYNGAAEIYQQVYRSCSEWQLEERKHFADLVRERGNPWRRCPLVLDLGCGPGRDLVIFSQLGLNPIGLDFASSMLTLAERSCCQLVEADFRAPLPFPDYTFAGVWGCSIVPNIPHEEFRSWIQEVRRTLVDSGILFISARNGREGCVTIPYLEDMVTYRACYTLQDLKGAISNGFRIIKAEVVKEYPTVLARK